MWKIGESKEVSGYGKNWEGVVEYLEFQRIYLIILINLVRPMNKIN